MTKKKQLKLANDNPNNVEYKSIPYMEFIRRGKHPRDKAKTSQHNPEFTEVNVKTFIFIYFSQNFVYL